MSTLHLLTVADVDCPRIGESCAIDQYAIHEFMAATANHIGIAFNEAGTLRKEEFELDAIRDAVASLTPGPEDVVVFHYAGHGFRSESKLSHWPAIALGYTDTGAIEGLDIDWIYRTLHQKHPRMLMVIADCCNETISDDRTRIHESRGKSHPTTERIEGLKTLFESFSGTVLGMGCEVGGRSSGGANGSGRGGHFTTTLLETIENQLDTQGNRAEWSEIMQIAAEPTDSQEPVWEVTSPQKGQYGGIQGNMAMAAKTFVRTRLVPFSGQWKKGRASTPTHMSATPSAAAPSAKFCSGCGNPLAAGSRFCGHCGAAVGQSAPAATPPDAASKSMRPPPALPTTSPATPRPSPTQLSARTTTNLDAIRQRQEDRAKSMEERAAARMARIKDRLNQK